LGRPDFISSFSNPGTWCAGHIGKHLDVERYFDTLRSSGLEEYPVKNFVILSQYLGKPLASFENGKDNAKISSAEKIVEVNGLLAAGVKDDRAKQFRLRDSNGMASLVVVFKYFPLNYTMKAKSGVLEPEIVAWRWEAEKLAESGQAGRAFSINGFTLSESEVKEITVEAKLTASSLPGDGIYCFKVVLRPKGYDMPEWISNWDMPIGEIEKWRRNPTEFDGATTYNMKAFLNDLWDTIVQLHRPKIAEFYCYVERGKR
jgi:hypothetical protein